MEKNLILSPSLLCHQESQSLDLICYILSTGYKHYIKTLKENICLSIYFYFYIVKIKKECSSLFNVAILLKYGGNLFSCERRACFNSVHKTYSSNILKILGNNETQMFFKQEFYLFKMQEGKLVLLFMFLNCY